MTDFALIRSALAQLDISASHAASGEYRPTVEEIFAPEHHAGALDPNTTIVLGARGAGKSFWAGVLGHENTKALAHAAFPKIGLDDLRVSFGYTGVANDGSVSKATIDGQVPLGDEEGRGGRLWRCVILRAFQRSLHPGLPPQTISSLMNQYEDAEEWENDCRRLDERAVSEGVRTLILFDALDSLATSWNRLRDLLDALLAVAWEIRGYESVRVKLFLRPDQIRDLGLRFVELPKMLSGATNLTWTGQDLYGMLYVRLGTVSGGEEREAIKDLFALEGISLPPSNIRRVKNWPLSHDRKSQDRIFTRLAGRYMGKGHKKGKTYDWPLNHLSDGHGEVTPRSFLTLVISAARKSPAMTNQALNPESIRAGLRDASRVRVNQLDVEFPWIKRVLLPLARLQVPCSSDSIVRRWDETNTISALDKRAHRGEFLPPFERSGEGTPPERLIARLVRIGVLAHRFDGRIDMPDLFRVAANLLKKGGVAPT